MNKQEELAKRGTKNQMKFTSNINESIFVPFGSKRTKTLAAFTFESLSLQVSQELSCSDCCDTCEPHPSGSPSFLSVSHFKM
jgi:hypothetical protein